MKTLVIICVIVMLSPVIFTQSTARTENVKEVNDFLEKVENGTVAYVVGTEYVDNKEWYAHPSFKGVYLKHLVLGKDTEGKLSCHLVKVEADCMLDEHLHDGKLELHEIIGGSGTCTLNGREITYQKGVICVIPANAKHKVVAGKDGLYILAKFAPALQ